MKLRAAVLGVADIARARKSHSNFPTVNGWSNRCVGSRIHVHCGRSGEGRRVGAVDVKQGGLWGEGGGIEVGEGILDVVFESVGVRVVEDVKGEAHKVNYLIGGIIVDPGGGLLVSVTAVE